jgi:hypothetical protein
MPQATADKGIPGQLFLCVVQGIHVKQQTGRGIEGDQDIIFFQINRSLVGGDS